MSIRPGSPLPRPAAHPPHVAFARDHDPAAVARRVRTAQWDRLCRGAFVTTGPELTREARALAVVVAVHQRLVVPHWFSHETAALLWGLPLWRAPRLTHVRQSGRPGAGRDRTVSRHGGAIAPGHVTVVGGLPVTDLEQTVVDCARTLTPLAALVVSDAALRAGADRTTILAMLEPLAGRNGATRARAVVELADAGAESPWESATRFVLLRDGLPVPETQVEVSTRLGQFWGDLGWAPWRTLLEYDGRGKYEDREALMREKRRHDAVVEAGWRILRVTKEDVVRGSALSARAHALLPAGISLVRRPLLRG